MVYLSSGPVSYLREEIAALASRMRKSLVSLYGEARDRCARVAKSCLDAGVAERQIKLAEMYGATIAAVLRNVFADGELNLSTTQRRTLPSLLRRHLYAVEASRSISGAVS
jgi:hypothetical protein